jgi:hypothetical protein
MTEKEIIIKKIDNNNNYIAYFKSDFLKATFCICFEDNVFGAVAVAEFFQMIKSKYSNNKITLTISEDKMRIKNPELLAKITKMGDK